MSSNGDFFGDLQNDQVDSLFSPLSDLTSVQSIFNNPSPTVDLSSFQRPAPSTFAIDHDQIRQIWHDETSPAEASPSSTIQPSVFAPFNLAPFGGTADSLLSSVSWDCWNVPTSSPILPPEKPEPPRKPVKLFDWDKCREEFSKEPEIESVEPVNGINKPVVPSSSSESANSLHPTRHSKERPTPTEKSSSQHSQPAVRLVRKTDSPSTSSSSSSSPSTPSSLLSVTVEQKKKIAGPPNGPCAIMSHWTGLGYHPRHMSCLFPASVTATKSSPGTIAAFELKNVPLNDLPVSFVIGVIGTHGSGKSTVLNSIAEALFSSSSSSSSSRSQKVMCTGNEPFPVEGSSLIDLGHPATMNVSCVLDVRNQVLLIDTPPINSPTLLASPESDLPPTTPGGDNPELPSIPLSPAFGLYRRNYRTVGYSESLVDIEGIARSCWIFRVCHVVLVVLDSVADLSTFRFIQTIEMMNRTIGIGFDVNRTMIENNSESISIEMKKSLKKLAGPRIVFVLNKTSPKFYLSPFESENVARMFDSFFVHADFCNNLSSRICRRNVIRGKPKSLLEILSDVERKKENREVDTKKGVDHVMLPFVPSLSRRNEFESDVNVNTESEENRNRANFAIRISKLLQSLRCSIPPSHHAISIREWMNSSSQLWDRVILSSPFLLDFAKHGTTRMNE